MINALHKEYLKKRIQPYWPLFLLLLSYILIITILALKHRFIYLSESVSIPLLILTALLSFQLKEFLNDWIIYLGWLMLFNALRGLAFSSIIFWQRPIYSSYVITLEKFFAFNLIVPVSIQHFFYQNQIISSYDDFFAMIYGTHFLVFILLGVVIWFTRREEFWRYKLSFILLSIIGISCFFIIPTMPPWMAAQHHLIPQVTSLTSKIYNLKAPDLFLIFNSNPVASMPSLHAAFAMMCTLISFHHYRWKGGIVLFYMIALYFSCLVLGAHYLVDLIAGNLLAIIVYYFVYHSHFCDQFKTSSIELKNIDRLTIKFSCGFLLLSIAFFISNLSSYYLQHAKFFNLI